MSALMSAVYVTVYAPMSRARRRPRVRQQYHGNTQQLHALVTREIYNTSFAALLKQQRQRVKGRNLNNRRQRKGRPISK